MMPGRSKVFNPAGTRLNTRMQQDAHSAEVGVSGLELQPTDQALFNQVVTAPASDSQRPITQYGPLAQSRLMLESKFPTDMSRNPGDPGQMRQAQIGIHQQSETSAAKLFKEQVQDITNRTQHTEWPGLSSTKVPELELQENLWAKDESLKYSSRKTNNENLRPKFNMQTTGQILDDNGKQTTYTHQGISALEQFKPSDTASQKNLFSQTSTNWSATSRELQTDQEQVSNGGQEQGEVLERIRHQLEDLTKSLDTAVKSQGSQHESSYGLTERNDEYQGISNNPAVKQEEMPLGHQRFIPDSHQPVSPERIDSGSTLNSYKAPVTKPGLEGTGPVTASGGGFKRTDNGEQNGLEFSGIPNYANSQIGSSPLEELNKRSQAEISAEANRIMGLHNSIESLSKSKFYQYMRDAEEHLMAGGYYHAASSYSLALIYQADNPLALAGRGHALLAAGEYVSSALFLSRALEVSPEYLRMKIDLVAILGDENKLQGRIADIKQWLARSDSGQLQFLLGYIYYRTGQLLEAKQVIDTAHEKMPELPAVRVMKITIDSMMIRQQ
jgi:hypothetical protein